MRKLDDQSCVITLAWEIFFICFQLIRSLQEILTKETFNSLDMEVRQHFVLAETTRKLQYILFKFEFKIPTNALAFLQKQSIACHLTISECLSDPL